MSALDGPIVAAGDDGTDWVAEMGQFIVNFKMTPGQYWGLTLVERESIIEAWNQANKKR